MYNIRKHSDKVRLRFWSRFNFASSIQTYLDRKKNKLVLTTFSCAEIPENKKKQTRMNNLRNKVQLIGHLGQAPEILTFENGGKMAKFSIATNQSYKNAKGEKVEDTQWHNITVWGKNVGIVEKYVTKGQEIAVEGKLVTRTWETKEGEKRSKTEVMVHELMLLGKKSA